MIGCFCLVSCICVSLKPSFIFIIALWGVKIMPKQKRPEQVMFRSYGLFWREDRIFWGWQGRKGHLNGQEVHAGTGKPTSEDPVDFRYQIGIYALYYDFELVYIGQAGAKKTDKTDSEGKSLLARLRDHRKGRHSERWDRFSWFGVQNVKSNKELSDYHRAVTKVTNRQILDLFEAVPIALSEPKLNLQRGNLNSYATQYSQWYDPAELGEQAIQQKRHPLQWLYDESDE